jgi:hypothetical protein
MAVTLFSPLRCDAEIARTICTQTRRELLVQNPAHRGRHCIASAVPFCFGGVAWHVFNGDEMLRKPRFTGTFRCLSKSSNQIARQLLERFSGSSKIIYAAIQSPEWHSNGRCIGRANAVMSLQLTDN